MKYSIFFLSLSVLLAPTAWAKPFTYLEQPNENYVKNDALEDQLENQVNCHLRRHLGPYSEYLLKTVLPRVTAELDLLLTPQKGETGDFIQVAEYIDYGDLFHSHVRVPLIEPDEASGKLDPRFTTSALYHLQYHSFERSDSYILNWIDELKQVPDPELQAWLQKQITLITTPTPAFTASASFSWEKPPALTERQREKFAALWLKHMAQTQDLSKAPLSWYKERVIEKLRFIDQGDRSFPGKINHARSVASFDDVFKIIRPLAFEGYIQPATVYFSKRSENPEIDKVIRQFERQGLKYLVNTDTDYFSAEAFPSLTNPEEHGVWIEKLSAAARRSKNTRSTFYNVFLDSTALNRQIVYAWNDQYLFSLRYFIPCKN